MASTTVDTLQQSLLIAIAFRAMGNGCSSVSEFIQRIVGDRWLGVRLQDIHINKNIHGRYRVTIDHPPPTACDGTTNMLVITSMKQCRPGSTVDWADVPAILVHYLIQRRVFVRAATLAEIQALPPGRISIADVHLNEPLFIASTTGLAHTPDDLRTQLEGYTEPATTALFLQMNAKSICLHGHEDHPVRAAHEISCKFIRHTVLRKIWKEQLYMFFGISREQWVPAPNVDDLEYWRLFFGPIWFKYAFKAGAMDDN